MAEIQRFSSRRQRLDHVFLRERLKGARSYKRIAGYFRSSIFELVGEEIAAIPKVQIVCNSELDAADVAVSQYVRETALKERWNEAPFEVETLLHRDRYRRLHELLTNGRVEIRVVPKNRVFIHGKAGVIEGVDGGPMRAIFIRAPIVNDIGDGVQTIASVKSSEHLQAVAVKKGRVLASSFHPELTEDTRLHAFFVRLAEEAQTDTNRMEILSLSPSGAAEEFTSTA